MKRAFAILDVFTDRAFGGNPLAVLPDAAGLDAATMQQVAAEFGFSESTFVVPPADPANHARVRIFTPRSELPFAGHPTVGTALFLAASGMVAEGEVLRLEEGAGPVPVPVRLDWKDGAPVKATFTAPRPPEQGEAADPAAVAEALELRIQQVMTRDGLPCVVSCGLPFLAVELVDLAALAAAKLRGDGTALAPSATGSIFLFTREAGAAGIDVRARMYAPGHGIAEDPATGSASAALAGHLAGRPGMRDGWHGLVVVQGVEMGRPSRIETRSRREGARVTAVEVGGRAVTVARGEIELPG